MQGKKLASKIIGILMAGMTLVMAGCTSWVPEPTAKPTIAITQAPSPTTSPSPTPTPQESELPEPSDKPVFYARPNHSDITIGGKVYRDELVDVREVIPGIQVNMMYAGSDNFMGRPLYSRDLCLLQKGTAEKLKKAQEMVQKDGLTLVVYDAYRPLSVQQTMYEQVKDSRYIANPKKAPSRHNRGAAVDVTLADSEGNLLDMPSEIDAFGSCAHRELPDIWQYGEGSKEYKKILKQYPDILEYPTRTEEQIENMNYLTQVMKKCGFTTISTEWWHFDDKDYAKYPATDHDFSLIPMVKEYI